MSKYKLSIVITIIFGLTIIVGGYFATIFIGKKITDNLIANYAVQEEVLAANVAKSLVGEVAATRNQLLVMGQNPLIREGETEECNTEIKRHLDLTHAKLGNVGRVDADGIFRCSLNNALIGTEANKLGAYIDDIFTDPSHNPVMSRAIKAPGAPGYLVALHVPVQIEEEFGGTLGGAIYLDEIQNKYLKDITFAKQGYVILFDDDYTILYHVRSDLIGSKATSTEIRHIINEAKVKKEGTARYTTVSQGLKIAGYATAEVVPGRQWIALVTVPVSDAQTDLENLGVSTLLNYLWIIVAFVVIFAEIMLLYLTQRFVFKPLKQIQEMKSDFVSLVSHQLKTPVAQIKGYVENMLEGLTGRVTKKQREYLNDMLNVANKNSKLIDDLLNISRIERGMLKIDIESLKLKELLEDVLDPLRVVAKTKGVDLQEKIVAGDVSISGDPVKTKEALRNIVDNAIKFTDPGKKVVITAGLENDFAVVTIADEGQGIDPNVQQELFQKNRVWSGKVKASGAGLGLFLSKQFIELTGGSITFKTEQGKGTIFIIKFRKA